jgi:RHS repeat-associated protein
MRTASPTATQLSKAHTHAPNRLRMLISVCLLLAIVFDADAQSSSSRLPKSLRISTPGTSATLLPDGQWLLLGGEDTTGAVATARLYNPAQKKFRPIDIGLLHARAYHTATLLPDGQVLVIGGEGKDGAPVVNAELFDPEKATFQALDNLGLIARTHHGATLLVDGRVLITGGSDVEGAALADAELFNPRSLQVERFNAKLETARLSHLATLLPNHHVLIWGGVDTDGVPVAGAELYDSKTQQFLPYDAASANLALAELNRPEPPTVVDSDPHNGAIGVGIDKILSLRFSKPLLVTSINAETVVLIGPDGHTPVKVTPTEGRLVAFIRPAQELLPNANYTLIVRGAVDEQQQPLDWVTIGFKTQTLEQRTLSEADAARAAASSGTSASDSTAQTGQTPTSAIAGNSAATTESESAAKAAEDRSAAAQEAAANDDEAWIPGAAHRKGPWRSGRKFAHSRDVLRQQQDFQNLFDGMSQRARDITRKHMEAKGEWQARITHVPLPGVAPRGKVPPGATQNVITGQVLKLDGKPLVNVTLSMARQTTRTDGQGEFVLTGAPSGQQVLVIDGRSADTGNKHYGRFEYQMEVKAGLNALDFTIWMPVLDTQHAMRLPSPTTSAVVVTNPDMPGFALHIPPGTVIRDAEGKIVTEVSITPIPADQLPFPMPYGDVPIFYTIQPGGAVLQSTTGTARGARLVYPNYSTQPAGARLALFDYDPRGRGWYIYTTGTVSEDGSTITPEKDFTIYQFTASSAASPGDTPASDGPKPDPCTGCCQGDPVSCADGFFLEANTDLSLADVIPVELTRTYRQNDANQRAYGVGTNDDFDMFLTFVNLNAHDADAIEMNLPHGGRVRFNPIGASHTYILASTIFEANVPGTFYKARLRIAQDGIGNDFWVTLKNGQRFVFSYFQSRLKRIEDRYGNRITIFRDSANLVTRVVSPQGRYLTFAHDYVHCSSCITVVTDNAGRAVNYDYDPSGRLVRVTDPKGGITEYTYDTAHRMLTVKDPRLIRKVLNQYDANGRVIKQTYADNTTTLFAYTLDAASKVIRTDVTHERLDVRRFTYSVNGYLLTDTRALGKPEQQAVTYERNATNLITKMTDALGRVTEYQYDAKGNGTKITRLFGTASATSWTYTYETVYNQLKSVTDPLGRTITLTYDSLGNLRQVTDPLANKSTFTYDALGRPVTATSYIGASPLTTTFTYDGPDLVQVKDPLNRIVTLTPDLVGRILSLRDPLGRLSRSEYDALDRITAQIDPQGFTARYGYDGNGNLLTFVNHKNQITRFAYDARNRAISKTDALLKVESYKYDAAGNPIFLTDRKGQVTGSTYDFLNRLTKVSYGATSTTTPVYTSSTTYVHDKANRLTTVQDSLAGNITRAYDNRFDTLTQEVTPEGTVNYSYYANGLRRTMTPSGGTAITYGYDAANRLASISQAAGAGGGPIPTTVQTVTMGYDTAGRQSSLKLPNGIQITYGYDNASQLTGITYKKSDATTVIGTLAYTYDANGQRTAIGGTLANTGHPKPFGVALYDANNKLTKLDAVTYTYDNNGNLLSDGTSTYTWNARDQLVSIAGANAATYIYDGLGRRRQKGTVGTLYDGWNPIQLKNGTTVVENRLTGLGLDAYYARVTGGVVQSYVTDALGSTLRLSDGTQNYVASYTYDPYGGTAGTANTNLVKYTGREQDFADLYYYRNRYYKPSIGRFISEDPIGLAGGSNLYGYVGGNPVNWLDPLGLTAKCPLSTPAKDDSAWKPYVGDPDAFHCGFDGYLENRSPTPEDPVAECFYDKGNLVEKGCHVYEGCRGTPDQYPAWDPRHIWPDSGGIVAHGEEGLRESQSYFKDHPKGK